jgi:hypothetical protein
MTLCLLIGFCRNVALRRNLPGIKSEGLLGAAQLFADLPIYSPSNAGNLADFPRPWGRSRSGLRHRKTAPTPHQLGLNRMHLRIGLTLAELAISGHIPGAAVVRQVGIQEIL